jgi:Ca2+-transporting ATPase
MAGRGLQVLGVAFRTMADAPREVPVRRTGGGLSFLGLVGMIDPPRPRREQAVRTCRSAGIRPVMITGTTRGPPSPWRDRWESGETTRRSPGRSSPG